MGSNDIHPMAVLYSLYRYAISENKYKLTVSELYREENKDGGPYLIFGIERSALEISSGGYKKIKGINKSRPCRRLG